VKAALALILLGALGLVVEGALVSVVPALLLPDVALVGSVAAALFLGGGPALVALAGLGFASDLLGGAPLGLHVLALLVPFVATRLANGSLELRRGFPEVLATGLRDSRRRPLGRCARCRAEGEQQPEEGCRCTPPPMTPLHRILLPGPRSFRPARNSGLLYHSPGAAGSEASMAPGVHRLIPADFLTGSPGRATLA